jgi:hypothetical protein
MQEASAPQNLRGRHGFSGTPPRAAGALVRKSDKFVATPASLLAAGPRLDGRSSYVERSIPHIAQVNFDSVVKLINCVLCFGETEYTFRVQGGKLAK